MKKNYEFHQPYYLMDIDPADSDVFPGAAVVFNMNIDGSLSNKTQVEGWLSYQKNHSTDSEIYLVEIHSDQVIAQFGVESLCNGSDPLNKIVIPALKQRLGY